MLKLCIHYFFNNSRLKVLSKVKEKNEKTTSSEIARDNLMQLPLKVSMI